jgi:hypothetical protein
MILQVALRWIITETAEVVPKNAIIHCTENWHLCLLQLMSNILLQINKKKEDINSLPNNTININLHTMKRWLHMSQQQHL